MKQAVIVLPTYNERENIKTLIPEIFRIGKNIKNWELYILVADDNSPDNTGDEVNQLKKKYNNLDLISGEKRGLGNAYKRGFSYALEKLHPNTIFEMDADWSHDPSLIPHFLKKIDEGAEFVIGSRYIKGGSIPPDWELYRKIFSFVGNIVIRLGFMKLSIHDWTTGYRAIRSDFIRQILDSLEAYNNYVFQIAVLDRAIKQNLRIAEVPLNFKERHKGYSKINSFQYIADTLRYVFFHSSFVKFCIVGVIGFIINSIGLEVFYQAGFSPGIAAAIGAEFAIVSNFMLNNFWSFSHKKITHKTDYLPKFLQFNSVSLGSVLIQLVVVGLGTHFFGDHTRFLFLVMAVFFFVIPYSYFMYNRVIWKHK